ncbi:MAG: large conductance mechanosensitive channel protein MscL [Dehalococcoidia bacterium]|nr:large conductance mechanosensitive channel protein MscL [Dehalococcoidia bacterium]HRC62655.1 large conductance mechanosensitive channel protein MscL [Dehalococcoidia bacterium]
MVSGFRDFIMRGNVIDLAVAVVIGAAFGAVVTALVENLINPLIAAIGGQPDLSSVATFTINNAQFSIGAVLNAAINFLIIAAAVYFVLVMPVNRLMEMRKRKEVAEVAATPEDIALLQEIRDLLKARGGAV